MTAFVDRQDERYVIADQRRLTWARCRADIAPLFTRHVTWRAPAAGDIKSKYRRTLLGPWWITATNAFTALIMGLVAGRFLGADMKTYLAALHGQHDDLELHFIVVERGLLHDDQRRRHDQGGRYAAADLCHAHGSKEFYYSAMLLLFPSSGWFTLGQSASKACFSRLAC